MSGENHLTSTPTHKFRATKKETPLYKSTVETMILNRINPFSIYVYLRPTKIHFENGKHIFSEYFAT